MYTMIKEDLVSVFGKHSRQITCGGLRKFDGYDPIWYSCGCGRYRWHGFVIHVGNGVCKQSKLIKNVCKHNHEMIMRAWKCEDRKGYMQAVQAQLAFIISPQFKKKIRVVDDITKSVETESVETETMSVAASASSTSASMSPAHDSCVSSDCAVDYTTMRAACTLVMMRSSTP